MSSSINILDKSWSEASNDFYDQLEGNIKELNSSKYPIHWLDILDAVDDVKCKSFLDVGCGVGGVFGLLKSNRKNVSYTGVDYAPAAISIAKKHWNHKNFQVMNFWDLSKEYLNQFDLIYAGALLDVLPNGDEGLDFILSLSAKKILLGRMEFTDQKSHYKEYTAYRSIKTCQFLHNKGNAIDIMTKKHSYTVNQMRWSLMLTK